LPKVKLKPFPCPTCGEGKLVYVEVEESTIKRAKRFPTIVTARCGKGHALVVFVDANFQVRDVEGSAVATEEEKDAVDKTKGWFESF
jgi:transcription elongation factor Elf1